MAFEADCGSSTVLEGIHVASTARPPVPAKWRPLPGTQVRRREQKRG
jgi:hypothetical protein